MQFKEYKKYLKRILDLKRVVNSNDVEFKDKVEEVYQDLKREAVEKGYKAILFNLLLKEEVPHSDIHLNWNNKYKISGYMSGIRLKFDDDIVDRQLNNKLQTINMDQYPRLRMLKEEGFGDIFFENCFYVMIAINFNFQKVNFDIEDYRQLVFELLAYLREMKDLLPEDDYWGEQHAI